MARLVVTTVGTTGDVVPYLALAEGLVARGHAATLVTHEMHRALVESRGVPFVAESDVCTVERFNAVIEEVREEKQPLLQFEGLLTGLFLRRAELRFEAHLAASAGADLVIANGFDFIGQEAAIRNGVPWASVTLMPHLVPTFEAPVYPLPNLGRWWIEATWKTLYEQSQQINRRTYTVLERLGAARRSLGVAGAVSDDLHLVAASRHLTHTRSDWPPQVVQTGAWHTPSQGYTPPEDLAAFLEAHPEPVVVTFGSMGGEDTAATNVIVREALERVGRPAIVQRGFQGLAIAGGADVFEAGFVPHDWLFRKAACVVHHCGAGTTFAAARAGAPSVAVPHLFDQYYWAGMLHERGLSSKPAFRKDLTARRLAGRIRAALHPKVRARAESVARRIAEERGVEAAVEAIERCTGQS